MKYATLLFFTLFLIACDAINPHNPKPTHTIQEVMTDIVTDNRHYQGETITLKAKVAKVTPYTANKDRIHLFTNNDDPPTFDVEIVADRKYRVGRSYIFKIYIERVYRGSHYYSVDARTVDEDKEK